MNGIELNKKAVTDPKEPSFTVNGGNSYRFRVIGTMEETVIRISIDDHKLIVVAADGYLTEPFETDILHVHVGERYDFILKAHTGDKAKAGYVFPIRIESVEVYCDKPDKPSRVGIAYLKYGTSRTAPLLKQSRCANCIALNCPFAHYPVLEVPYYNCYNVYDALKLLVPTPKSELPDNTSPAKTMFFNHAFHGHGGARVNDVRFKFPTQKPFTMNGAVQGECKYADIQYCYFCPHTVHIDKTYHSKSIEFVLSSLPREVDACLNRDRDPMVITKLRTHPIHLHGHSFFVKKIGYPTYSTAGKIERTNEDVAVPECGPGKWKNNVRPPGLRVDERTIRKDTVIIPAGGYVVIEFKVQNPGWWIMHCHIDHHLLEGMGIVIGEMPECQNPLPAALKTEDGTKTFCWDVSKFQTVVINNVCNNLQSDEFEYFDTFNGDKNDEPADKPKKSLYYETDQQHPRAIRRRSQNERDGSLDGESREWFKKK